MNNELRDIAKALQHMDRQMADIVRLQKTIIEKLTKETINGKKENETVSEETQ